MLKCVFLGLVVSKSIPCGRCIPFAKSQQGLASLFPFLFVESRNQSKHFLHHVHLASFRVITITSFFVFKSMMAGRLKKCLIVNSDVPHVSFKPSQRSQQDSYRENGSLGCRGNTRFKLSFIVLFHPSLLFFLPFAEAVPQPRPCRFSLFGTHAPPQGLSSSLGHSTPEASTHNIKVHGCFGGDKKRCTITPSHISS